MGYHTFTAEDGSSYGSFEVFYVGRDGLKEMKELGVKDLYPGVGWYWWACFPGCLPDGDPQGPFKTEREAIEAAREED